MRRFRDIIEDIKAPSIQNLWLNGGKLKYYGENGWQDIKGQDASTIKWDDIEDKPKTFAPSSHTHTKSDITDFPTYNAATPSANGLMSAADKSKLDNIASNANNYTLPNASTSVRGGVLMAATVADLAGTEDAAAICAKVNALLSALRASGALQS